MRLLRFIPAQTHFDFVGKRMAAFAFSIILAVAAVASLWVQGLNLGIDFQGGLLMEVRSKAPVHMEDLRTELTRLDMGEIELQQFGEANDILIRVQQPAGGEQAQQAAVKKIQETLGQDFEYRRVELVGPKVGQELLRDGLLATFLAMAMIAVYVAVRFEWQFGVAALVATFHDVLITLGLFSVTRLEFNLTAVAALLTLAGYSINDTVVVFDRLRENLRRHRSMPMAQMINETVNQMLSRTIMTSTTTLMAIFPLLIYGGETLRNFTVAMSFGIILGTFSSIYMAASLLLYLKPLRPKPQ